jgi:hypothetical protein
MKQITLFIACLLALVSEAQSQIQYSYTASPASYNTIPFYNGSYNQRQWLYYPGNFAGNNPITIDKIYFRIVPFHPSHTNFSFTNLNIKIGHTALTTFTAGAWVTGLTTVYNTSWAGTAFTDANGYQWVEIVLQTPFTWNGTSNFILEASQLGYYYTGLGFTIMQTTGVGPRSLAGNSTSSTAVTQNVLAWLGLHGIGEGGTFTGPGNGHGNGHGNKGPQNRMMSTYKSPFTSAFKFSDMPKTVIVMAVDGRIVYSGAYDGEFQRVAAELLPGSYVVRASLPDNSIETVKVVK